MSLQPFPDLPVVLVDDEPQQLESFALTLNTEGIDHILKIDRSRAVPGAIERSGAALLVLDLTMPEVSGEELLAIVRRRFPDLPVIVFTGQNDVETAVRCMRAGATDYLLKPLEPVRFVSAVKRALEIRELQQENASLKESLLSPELKHPEAFHEVITRNAKMRHIFHYLEAIAPTNRPVLITGETGVGKELLAKAVHALSGRRGRYLTVNAAGLDDTLFSDSLFGHLRGAFSGAERARQGMIEQAKGGTLFLDEIGDLEPVSQVKLLRLIQEKEYYPLGSDHLKTSEARIVVATHRNLLELIEQGRFRQDLYYRLGAHQVDLPPLRERPEDLPLLVDHFLTQAGHLFNRQKPAMPPELHTVLANYSFPGNVRELQSLIFDAVAQHRGKSLSIHRFKALLDADPMKANPRREAVDPLRAPQEANFSRLPTLAQGEVWLIEQALERTGGNQTQAANILGISRASLIRRLRKLGHGPAESSAAP